MSNCKDMMAVVESLVNKKKPFLIIKYCISMCGDSNNAYEIVTIGGSRLRYTPIDRRVAIKAIKDFELPILHELDNRNMIWGDEMFKEKYNTLCKGEI